MAGITPITAQPKARQLICGLRNDGQAMMRNSPRYRYGDEWRLHLSRWAPRIHRGRRILVRGRCGIGAIVLTIWPHLTALSWRSMNRRHDFDDYSGASSNRRGHSRESQRGCGGGARWCRGASALPAVLL